MSENKQLEDVYAAIEESAGLLSVPCAREKVWPILTAYQESLAEAALVIFSMAGGERHRGELDYSFSMGTGGRDPYEIARSSGLAEETDHPISALLSDIRQRCPIDVYGVDCGVVGGFKKAYTFFPLGDLQQLSKLVEMPAMPPAVAENAGVFARYGLQDNVSVVAIDYQAKTMNVYFGRFPAERLEPETLLPMLRDLGLPEPSDQMLKFIQKSFSIYATFNWDSSKIERICFAVITTDPMELPAQVDPEIGMFAQRAPYIYEGDRILVYGSALGPGGEYHKLGAYYQSPAETRKLLTAFDSIDRGRSTVGGGG